MLEKLQEMGVSGLEELASWIKGTEEFVAEQAPLICQEVILKGQGTCVLWIGIFIILISCVILCKRAMTKDTKMIVARNTPDADRKELENNEIAQFFLCAPIVGLAIGIVLKLHTLWFITFCPRLYLAEEIAKFIKQLS